MLEPPVETLSVLVLAAEELSHDAQAVSDIIAGLNREIGWRYGARFETWNEDQGDESTAVFELSTSDLAESAPGLEEQTARVDFHLDVLLYSLSHVDGVSNIHFGWNHPGFNVYKNLAVSGMLKTIMDDTLE